MPPSQGPRRRWGDRLHDCSIAQSLYSELEDWLFEIGCGADIAESAMLLGLQIGENCQIGDSVAGRPVGAGSAVTDGMTPAELRARTEAFSIRALTLTNPLLDRLATRDCALQLRRSATSVAQNYGACTIAKSHADFVSKLRLTLEEADESARWIRILRDAQLAGGPEMDDLLQEATELARILGASCVTATRNAARYARRSGRAPAATPPHPMSIKKSSNFE